MDPGARTSASIAALLAAVIATCVACGGDVATEPPSSGAVTGATSSSADAAGATSSGTGGAGAMSSGTSASSGAQSVGGLGGAGGGMGGAGGAVMTLDPDTLEVFDLPIDSIRYAVAGHDGPSNTCVTLVWWGSPDPICASSDMLSWPYAILTPGAAPPCMQWDYAGNVDVDGATGCVEFTYVPPLTAMVDVTVQVSSAAFTGTIVVDNVP